MEMHEEEFQIPISTYQFVKHFIEDLEEAFNAPNFSARLAHINL
jgi:uncharacterized protein YutD